MAEGAQPIEPGPDPVSIVPKVSWNRLALAAILGGLLAGAIGGGLGELVWSYFRPTYIVTEEILRQRMKYIEETNRQDRVSTFRTSQATFAGLGFVTALVLGTVGGIVSRSAARGAVVGLVTGLIGGAVVLGSTSLILPWFFRSLQTKSEAYAGDLTVPFLVHLGMWAGVGLFGGIALSLATGGRKYVFHGALGGLLGALVGTILFDGVGAVVFPQAKTYMPLAEDRIARLLMHLFVALLTALGAVLVLRPSRSNPLSA